MTRSCEPALALAKPMLTPLASPRPSWQSAMPVLNGSVVVLRDLEMSDAPTLFAMLTTAEVSRHISPPPATLDAFERFIAGSHRERAAGRCACFAVVPTGMSAAIGLFQLREIEPDWATIEWGFAIGAPFWGTGVFMDAAPRVIDFAFGTLGAHRLEARAAVQNGRGNAALRKIGAIPEAVLRKAFERDGRFHDQVLWSIVHPEERQAKAVWGRTWVN